MHYHHLLMWQHLHSLYDYIQYVRGREGTRNVGLEGFDMVANSNTQLEPLIFFFTH